MIEHEREREKQRERECKRLVGAEGEGDAGFPLIREPDAGLVART